MVGKEQLIWGLVMLEIAKYLTKMTKMLQMTKIKIFSRRTLTKHKWQIINMLKAKNVCIRSLTIDCKFEVS
jgi:hypothetical protein